MAQAGDEKVRPGQLQVEEGANEEEEEGEGGSAHDQEAEHVFGRPLKKKILKGDEEGEFVSSSSFSSASDSEEDEDDEDEDEDDDDDQEEVGNIPRIPPPFPRTLL